MASSVFYKFKSQRDESRVTFDGTGISVFDLKKEIIIANNLGKANDFDLVVQGTSGEGLSRRIPPRIAFSSELYAQTIRTTPKLSPVRLRWWSDEFPPVLVKALRPDIWATPAPFKAHRTRVPRTVEEGGIEAAGIFLNGSTRKLRKSQNKLRGHHHLL